MTSTGRPRFGGLIGVAFTAALLASCATDAATTAPEPPSPSLPTTAGAPHADPSVVTDALDAPWSVAFHDGTALLSERDTARILELDSGGTTREIAVIDGVVPRGEGGLLGIAVHSGHLYAYFTASGDNRIERYELDGQPGALTLGAPETILDGLPAASFHNGGRIAFGPDGMLYVTAGDAGRRESAQDRDSLAGKILRLTPEGDVPEDNPWPGSPVYSYGHRNPQGIAWTADGTLYASEFGQNTWDELNVIEPGGNYGWPEVEGIGGRGEFIDPILQWDPAEASPSGIAITGDSLYMANLRGERLIEIPLSNPEAATEHFVGEYGRLRDVTVAPDGSLWMLTNNTDGRGEPRPGDDRILRFAPAP